MIYQKRFIVLGNYALEFNAATFGPQRFEMWVRGVLYTAGLGWRSHVWDHRRLPSRASAHR